MCLFILYAKPVFCLLLSDVAYQSAFLSHQNFKSVLTFELNDKEKSFKKIKINYNDQWYKIPFKKRAKNIVSVSLPIYLDTPVLKLYGYKKQTRLWHRRILLNSKKLEDLNSLGGEISLIDEFNDFRGNLIFADSIERVTHDYNELSSRQNAIFIKAVNKNLSPVFYHFFDRNARFSKDNLTDLIRNPLSTNFKKSSIYYYDLNKLYKFNIFKAKISVHKLFIDNDNNKSDNLKTSDFYACRYKKFTEDTYYDLSKKITGDHLVLRLFQSTSCPGVSKSHKNTKYFEIALTKKLKQALKSLKIHDYSLEKNRKFKKSDLRFYSLFLKTSNPARFMTKKVSDDIVLILNKYFVIDGSFSIKNTYYSPRNNVAFFANFSEALMNFASR